MSLAINIYKKTRNILLVLVNKIDNMKLWSLLALNGRSHSLPKKLEKTASSSHKQASILNSRRGHNEDNKLNKSEILHTRHYC